MTITGEKIIREVANAGHWGVVRSSGIISVDQFRDMAKMVGMSVEGSGFRFRNEYFADGVTDLNPKAVTALSILYEINREDIENLNKQLSSH